MSDNVNAQEQWRGTLVWYEDYVLARGCEEVRPVVELIRWAANQEWTAHLFPGTSLNTLCLHTKPGYNPELPFFSCNAQSNGEIAFQMFRAVGDLAAEKIVPADEAHEVFEDYAKLLNQIE